LVYDNLFCYNYVVGGKIALSTITPHFFGLVPVIEYRNNSEAQGDFEQEIPLIDAYNLVQSDRVNDKEQLVDALMVIKGMTLTEEQHEAMKSSRIMAGLDKDTSVEYLVKNLNEADADVLRSVIEQDIHKVSMTPNLTDVNFVGNSSGVAIRYKLLAFEQSVLNKERYFERGLLERFKLYNNYLTKLNGMETIPTYEVDVVFKRNLPQNDLETSQMLANLYGMVDIKTLIGQLSFIDDAEKVMQAVEEEKLKKEEEQSKMFGTPNPVAQGVPEIPITNK
jgi:SPP1 family phage portal protein